MDKERDIIGEQENKTSDEQILHPGEARVNPKNEDIENKIFSSDTDAMPYPSGSKQEKTESDPGPESAEENAAGIPAPAEAEKKPEASEAAENNEAEDNKETEAEDNKTTEAEEATEANKAIEAEDAKTTEGKEKKNHDQEGEHHEEEEDNSHPDYRNYSKKDLVKVINSLAKENDIRKTDRILKEIKPAYDEIAAVERAEALENFIAGGGGKDDFDYKPDELDVNFDANFTLLKDRKAKHLRNIEKQKEENLAAKNELLERLRKLVDDEETTASIDSLKEIQKQWKAIGQIPGQHVKNLWANYNALIDRYYDNRSIYFELKELDRRKNMEAKIELCEKAESLKEEENLKKAIKELNELHDEYKHIGPVPKEEQEPLWQRFKTASDNVYARRRDYVERLKTDLKKNLASKKVLGDKVQEFLSFDTDRINDWNIKTKEILEIQKQWEAIGGLPRDSAKDINRHFWSAFKGFFYNKSAFFKKLEEKREENLKQKQAFVQRAEELKENTDWVKTANELKKLQREWKEIGPVPEKYRNSAYHEFKKACDHFFDNKRNKNKEVVQEYDENLKKKEGICEQIEEMAKAHSTDLERLAQLQDEFNAIGFVPRNEIKNIQNRFMEAVNAFAKSADNLDAQERHNIELAAKFNKLKGSPNSSRKIHQKEHELRKQIGKLENDISLWKNNLEFFADSKKADKLKEDFNEKIDKAKKELKEMQDQLYIIRNI